MNATSALGWALVHFLWQGAALALLLAGGLALTPHAAARTRYMLSLCTLAAMLIAPLATGIGLSQPGRSIAPITVATPVTEFVAETPSPAPPVTVAGTQPAEQTLGGADRVAAFRDFLTPALPWLVIVWLLGVIVLSVRLAHGWLSARRLRTMGTRATSAWLQQTLARLAARMRVSRPVQLLESLIVEVPAVIGWLRPVILVPASALTGLTPQQLEVLLAHELAHVRRYDYILNVAQCVIETLLFYHPAVWWVSRRVREEREHCCDDLVVQLCGDRHLYASALVDMERLRPPAPLLALAATGRGGSLLQRITRLVTPDARARGRELFPRWSAGLAGVVAVTVALLAAGSDRLAGEPTEPQSLAADTVRTAPDTVLRHPDPSQTLAQRWDWARAQARQLGKRGGAYWIGYQISRPEWLEHSVYIDRATEVIGQNIRMSGRMFGDFEGLVFRGVRLAPLARATDSDDIAILFGFSDRGGNPTLTSVHVASIYLPMDFRGHTLLWVGPATDAQSIPLVEGLFTSTPQPELREDIVSAVGIHGSSQAVVPILQRWLTSREPADVRSQAAEWLGFHPTAAAVAALTRAARSDPSGDVRGEAAEALGENTLPAATDSVIAIARSASDPDTRREAVEGLGQKDGDRALSTLSGIARDDRDEDVIREAVEALGEMSGGRGMSAVRDLARNHPRADVRREAVETLGEHFPSAEAISLLKAIAATDPDADVQRKAIETLGELRDERAYTVLVEFARTHPNSDVRREAIETLGETGHADSVIVILGELATRNGTSSDDAREAVETLGELRETRALAIVARIARSHRDIDVRREAIETYAEQASTDSAVALLKALLASEAPEDVYHEVLESLEELEGGAGIPAIIDAVRSHPSREVRAEALRRLAESDDPRAQQIFDQTLRRP